MKTTHCYGGGVLFFLHHNHQQGAHFPYPLRRCAGVGRFLPPPHFTTSAVATEYNHHVLHICRPHKWIFKAKSYSTNNSDVNIVEDDVEEREYTMKQLDDNLQDFIDSLWIFKVFRSYGYMLPFIILSMLIATGLKAFLLALALPLWLSTFSYAIQKIQEDNSSSIISKQKQKTKTNYKKRPQTPSTENRNIKKSAKKPWGPASYDSNETTDQNTISYGGWDELDRCTEYIVLDSSGSSDQTDGGGSYNRTSQMGKSSSSSEMMENDGTRPFLLRLFIAVFPFLDSLI